MALAVIQDDARRPADFQIVDLNAAAAKLLGAPAEGLRWRRLGEEGLGFAAEPLAEGLRRLIAASGERERFELTLARRSGGALHRRQSDADGRSVLRHADRPHARSSSARNPIGCCSKPIRCRCGSSRRARAACSRSTTPRSSITAIRATASSPCPPTNCGFDDAEAEEAPAEADGARRPARAPSPRRRRADRRARLRPRHRLRRRRGRADGDRRHHRAPRAEAEAAYLARHDALTGLSNRADFRARLTSAIEAGRPGGRRLAICCVDLDLFKDVNDTYGHPTGDRLLRMVAQRLRDALGERDFAARHRRRRIRRRPRRRRRAGRDRRDGGADDRGAVAALRDRRHRGDDRRQRRRRAVPRRRRQRRRTDQERRPRALPGEVGGAAAASLLPAGPAARRPGAAGARSRSARRAGRAPARGPLPAAGRHFRPPRHRLRGAAALAPSDPRHDRAQRLHPDRRGERADRADRRMGAAHRLRRRGELAATRSPSPSICRRSSSAPPT